APRRACEVANRSRMGAALGPIIPTIIAAHIVNVSRTPTTPPAESIDIPMALDDAWVDDACPRRYTRYAHASAETKRMQVAMRIWSRRGTTWGPTLEASRPVIAAPLRMALGL